MRKSPISRYKKFFLLLYMLLSFFIFLSSCSQPSPLPIDENIMHLMEFKGYQECDIISLANYENLHEFYGVSELLQRLAEKAIILLAHTKVSLLGTVTT